LREDIGACLDCLIQLINWFVKLPKRRERAEDQKKLSSERKEKERRKEELSTCFAIRFVIVSIERVIGISMVK